MRIVSYSSEEEQDYGFLIKETSSYQDTSSRT